MKSRAIIIEIGCFMLIGLFLFTASVKWLDFHKFSNEMNFQPFNDRFTPALVFLVPVVESLIAILLIFQRTRVWGLYGALTLVALYTGYIILILFKVWERYPCSCIGVVRMGWVEHLYFNFAILLLISIMLVLHKRPWEKTMPFRAVSP